MASEGLTTQGRPSQKPAYEAAHCASVEIWTRIEQARQAVLVSTLVAALGPAWGRFRPQPDSTPMG